MCMNILWICCFCSCFLIMCDDFLVEFINIWLWKKEINNNFSIGCGISIVDRY